MEHTSPSYYWSVLALPALIMCCPGCGPAGTSPKGPANSLRQQSIAVASYKPAVKEIEPKQIDDAVEKARSAWGVPGVALAVVHDDKVIHLRGYGECELGSGKPVGPDTVFPMASCTKAFTTAALAILVDEGKMAWDDPVRKHVAFFKMADPEADAKITIRDLLCHRCGLRAHELLWYRSPWGQEEIIRKIGFVKPDFPFRSTFHYQTTMFQTAGLAAGVASGGSWADLVHDRLVEPLEMKSTTFTTGEALRNDDHASPHRSGKDGQVKVVPWYEIRSPDPAGSMHSSARDLGQWLRLQLNEGVFAGRQIVSIANLGETHTPQIPIPMDATTRALNPESKQLSYGMGWVIQDYRGQKQVAHAGVIDGFRAHITLLPEARLGFAVLANRHETRLNLALSNALADLFLGLPSRNWDAYYGELVAQEVAQARTRRAEHDARRKLGTKPSLPLSAYVGSYEEPAYGTAKITLEGGPLVWQWSSFKSRLVHFQDDIFTIDDELLDGVQVHFTMDAKGDLASMQVALPLGVEFRRVK
jgi:CubicO group peptidase (beta-lactamase class C family)